MGDKLAGGAKLPQAVSMRSVVDTLHKNIHRFTQNREGFAEKTITRFDIDPACKLTRNDTATAVPLRAVNYH